MSVETYSLARDGDTNISKNFKVREFRSKDGADEILIDSELVEFLQIIRNWAKAPVIINSAYRTPEHNQAIGGSSTSYHVKGCAADFGVNGKTVKEVAAFAEMRGVPGIGAYDREHGEHIHIDTRSKQYFWRNASDNAVSTFGGGLLGDVNGDGKIDAADAQLILQDTVELKRLTEDQIAHADMDGDGVITPTDALYVLQIEVGLR